MAQEIKQSSPAPRFLGRGPGFWFGTTAATTAALVGLAASGAIENKGLVMALFAIPLANFVALFLSLLNANAAAQPSCIGKGEAQRRYIKRVAVFTSAYLAGFAALTFLDQLGEFPQAVRIAVAVLPGLAIIGVFWAIARLILEETDEFLRMLTIRQTLIASALAMSAASIWGFLEGADLVPHIDAYWYAVIWFGGLMVGALVNRIEHGTWGAV